MSFNPERWLWGVIPIGMLSWITYTRELPSIEADLLRRGQARLAAEGHEWAAVRFSGRDALLAGRAAEEHAPKDALNVLRSVWGVRGISLHTDLVGAVSSYAWSARRSGGHVELSGFVANETMRKAVVEAARANFPRTEISDRMTLARGVPDREVWLGGIAFSLKQLAGLKRGEVSLAGIASGAALSVSGEAADPASYRSNRRVLAQGLPKGLRLAISAIAPAVVSPFTWSAVAARNQIVLSGHAPSDATRDEIFALARKTFPTAAIVDRTETAGGAPAEWMNAAAASLELLAALELGATALRDRELTLSGTVTGAAREETLRRVLRERVPAAFRIVDGVEHPDTLSPSASEPAGEP